MVYCVKRVGLLALAKDLNFLMGALAILLRSGNLTAPSYGLETGAYRISLGLLSSQLVLRYHCGPNDVNGVGAGTMSAGHVHV